MCSVLPKNFFIILEMFKVLDFLLPFFFPVSTIAEFLAEAN